MNEATAKAALCKVLRAAVRPAGGVVYRHEDTFTGGIPDISVNLDGRTVWAEVKLNRPGRPGKVTPLQQAALTSLHGVLITYTVDKAGGLSATVVDFRLRSALAGSSSYKAAVHRTVAQALLNRLAQQGARSLNV